MKIYKYLHSCLLFEKDHFKLLVDPGNISFEEKLIIPEDFSDVSAIIITHSHPDHLDIPNLRKILVLSNAEIYANEEVGAILKKEKIKFSLIKIGKDSIGPFQMEFFQVEHEPILDSPLPQMTAFTVDEKVLNPADSFTEKLASFKGIELLLLPIMAPFATEINVAKFADSISPAKILPIHDGYAKDFFLKQRYANYKKHFADKGIQFIELLKLGDHITI
jgi:L-ascorbate metabolism protein UlaG (beta-lactamase superfamily)